MTTAASKKPAPGKPAVSSEDGYREWYSEQVRLGVEDIETGRVVAHEEVVSRGRALLKRLDRKHVKAA